MAEHEPIITIGPVVDGIQAIAIGPRPFPFKPVEQDEDPEPCVVCGLTPCDCDRLYDSWKERDL